MTDREIDVFVDYRIFGVNPPPKGWGRLSEIPRYSTDPAAWDQLLDKMAADGWSYQIVCYSNLSKVVNAGTFGCMFVNADESHKVDDAPTKGRAICLAALEAVKGKA